MRDVSVPVVFVPCFSGAAWDLPALTPLADRPRRALRLPEGLDQVEAYADFVASQVADLDQYVLVGDSFGAVISLGVAVRRPRGLRALVLSGGFAANPVKSLAMRAKLGAARFMVGPLYRHVTLRLHAAALASPYDAQGEVAWSAEHSRRLFVDHTPRASYLARVRATFAVDYRPLLSRIEVPTLVLTPADDRLIGREAAAELTHGIPDATEVILPETGHMFRFSHPRAYATAVRRFLDQRLVAPVLQAS